MDDTILKKRREAAYFLKQMVQETGGELETIEHLISAFLSAARTVELRATHVYGDIFRTFRAGWKIRHPVDEVVTKQMADDRNNEVHERGSRHIEAEERIRIPTGMTYTDKSGTHGSFGPPDMPPTEIRRPGLFFHIDGADVPVVDRCTEYLDILGRMLNELEDLVNPR